MVTVMKLEKAPQETYADIGGLDQQIQEIKESVELPLTHPEYYEEMGIRPPKGLYLPYARHYKPRLIFFFTQFSLQLRLILQTIYVLKTEILHFLSLKSAAYKRERPQIESGL